MKENKPWYVRLNKLTKKESSISFFVISTIVAAVLCSIISYYIMTAEPMAPYEEAYDIEFNTYANGILEDIADKVINTGINTQNIPEIVSKYDIKYTNQKIEFNYVLDNSRVIYEYYSETGKKPYNDASQRRLEMNIRISNDFQDIEKTSFLSTLPNREDYEQLHNQSMRSNAVLYGVCASLIYITIWFLTLEILYKASEKWERKKERDTD